MYGSTKRSPHVVPGLSRLLVERTALRRPETMINSL